VLTVLKDVRHDETVLAKLTRVDRVTRADRADRTCGTTRHASSSSGTPPRPAERAVIFRGWGFSLVLLGGQAPHTTRPEGPHGAYVRGAKRTRTDPHWREIERLAVRTRRRAAG